MAVAKELKPIEEIDFKNYEDYTLELLKESISFRVYSIDNIPKKSGIYLFYTKEGDLLYVGRSVNLHARIKQHIINQHSHILVPYIHKIKILFTNKEENVELENKLINSLYPIFNKDAIRYQSLYDELYKNDKSDEEKMLLLRDLVFKWREKTGLNSEIRTLAKVDLNLIDFTGKENKLIHLYSDRKSNESEQNTYIEENRNDMEQINLEDISSYLTENQRIIISIKQAIKCIEGNLTNINNKHFIVNNLEKLEKMFEEHINKELAI